MKPRKALNKAYLKVKPNRTEIESSKTNLISLLDRTNDTELRLASPSLRFLTPLRSGRNDG